jgi:hypothetical protein
VNFAGKMSVGRAGQPPERLSARVALACSAALAAAAVSLLLVSSAGAATITVGTATDQGLLMNGTCSLREAIGVANFDAAGNGDCTSGDDPGAEADEIVFAGALTGQTISLTDPNGELLITDTGDQTTITGPGMDLLTIDGPSDDRVIEAVTAAPLRIEDLNIEGGNRTEDNTALGGGIYAGGPLEIENVRVADNTATATAVAAMDASALGGGIYATGASFTLDASIVEDNIAHGDNPLNDDFDAYGQGGGIIAGAGTNVIRDSTISGNVASAQDDQQVTINSAARAHGGGLSGGNLEMRRTTVSGNKAEANSDEGGAFGLGGGLFINLGDSRIELSTVAGNTENPTGETSTPGVDSIYGGGGITDFTGSLDIVSSTIAQNGPETEAGAQPGANLRMFGGPISLVNVIVADPRGASTTNCSEAVQSGGNNLDDGTSCDLDAADDIESTDPTLGALDSNGGPTKTMLPQTGSAVIDAGSAGDQIGLGDQRGGLRPVNAPAANADDGADIGAVEIQAPVTPTVTVTDPVSPSTTDTTPKVKGTYSAGPFPWEALINTSGIRLYTDSACTQLAVSGDPGAFQSTGLEVTVQNTSTTFHAASINTYGIISPCSSSSVSFTHDSLGPVVTIAGAATTTDRTPAFTFTGPDPSGPVAYQCSVDSGAFAACTSPFTAASLKIGAHTLGVRGADALGNQGAAATKAFTITCPKGKKPKKGKCVKKKRKKRK